MKRAQSRDAVHRETFYFRKSVVPEDDTEDEKEEGDPHPRSHDHEYTLMSIDTIINGKVCCCDSHIPVTTIYGTKSQLILCTYYPVQYSPNGPTTPSRMSSRVSSH